MFPTAGHERNLRIVERDESGRLRIVRAGEPPRLRIDMVGPDETGRLRISRTDEPPGLRIEGAVDFTTGDLLAAALTTEAHRDTGDIRADLSALDFIDVEGLRTFVATARELNGDRALILFDPPAHLRHLFELTGWLDTPGLRLDGRA